MPSLKGDPNIFLFFFFETNIKCELSQFSECVGGRKISYEKSVTGFSIKVGSKKTSVIQEFDAFTSNTGVDLDRYLYHQAKAIKIGEAQKIDHLKPKETKDFEGQTLSCCKFL